MQLLLLRPMNPIAARYTLEPMKSINCNMFREN